MMPFTTADHIRGLPHHFSGMSIYPSALCTETVEDKTRVDKFISLFPCWNPCNREAWKVRTKTKPTAYMTQTGLIAHPSIIAELGNIA